MSRFEVAPCFFLESGFGSLLVDLLQSGGQTEIDVPFKVQDERVAGVLVVVGL